MRGAVEGLGEQTAPVRGVGHPGQGAQGVANVPPEHEGAQQGVQVGDETLGRRWREAGIEGAQRAGPPGHDTLLLDPAVDEVQGVLGQVGEVVTVVVAEHRLEHLARGVRRVSADGLEQPPVEGVAQLASPTVPVDLAVDGGPGEAAVEVGAHALVGEAEEHLEHAGLPGVATLGQRGEHLGVVVGDEGQAEGAVDAEHVGVGEGAPGAPP